MLGHLTADGYPSEVINTLLFHLCFAQEGGCSVPIGVTTSLDGNQVRFVYCCLFVCVYKKQYINSNTKPKDYGLTLLFRRFLFSQIPQKFKLKWNGPFLFGPIDQFVQWQSSISFTAKLFGILNRTFCQMKTALTQQTASWLVTRPRSYYYR